MRIVYLSADFGIPIYGSKGASIHVREFAAALQTAGHDVRIITCRSGDETPAGFDVPVRTVRLDVGQQSVVDTMKDDPAVPEPMRKEIRSLLYGVTLGRELLPELERWRPHAIYERYSLLGVSGVELARRLGIPLLLEVNAPLADEAETHRGIGFRHTVHETERMILRSADRVLAVSAELRAWLIAAGVAPERIVVTPNRVNIQRFATVGRTASSQPTVGFVGTLKPWHGSATLVRAVGEIARQRGLDAAPHLLIVGDGPQREMLEALAREQGIASLARFTGTIAHEEIPARISEMDIAVAPYDPQPDFYFSPLKIFEYMAAGRAIVAARIGQIPEILEHGRTGLLVEPGDATALAASISSLLDDPRRIAVLGENARRTAIDHHGWDRNAQVVGGIIKDLLATAGGDH
ncbi:MAG: glycosyltransferase family 4 protein [Thermomicrobiales bacterium]|nr:glycosyltransferase family 4 protein [Thermomicrobiales bacterium]